MFKSKLRPIVIPQYEHLKLAGALAYLWGNDAFARPPTPFASFVTGVGLHDRAYGMLDNLPIGEFAEAEWMALTRRSFDTAWADPVAEAITRLHLQRLVSYGSAPARQALAAELAQAIDAHMQQYELDRALFERIDRVTRLCDDIAFAFCFEAPAEGSVRVFPRYDRDEEVEVQFHVAGGVISVDPWPFGASSAAGYLVGYQLPGYPQILEPVLVPYTVGVRV